MPVLADTYCARFC